MRAPAEAQVIPQAPAVEVDPVRVVEVLWVAVRRGPQEQDARSLGEFDIAQLRVALDVAVVAAERRLQADRLLDELRNQRRVRAELALQLLLLGQNPHRVAGETGSRFATRAYQHHENRGSIVLGDQAVSHASSQLADHSRGRLAFGRS